RRRPGVVKGPDNSADEDAQDEQGLPVPEGMEVDGLAGRPNRFQGFTLGSRAIGHELDSLMRARQDAARCVRSRSTEEVRTGGPCGSPDARNPCRPAREDPARKHQANRTLSWGLWQKSRVTDAVASSP